LYIFLDFLYNLQIVLVFISNTWWPWFNVFNAVFFIQFFLVCTFFYMFFYKNIYYILLYVFTNFFLVGIYLAFFQIELFTAFLWLIECSVLFIFLLLLFYLNVKGSFSFFTAKLYAALFLTLFVVFVVTVCYSESNIFTAFSLEAFNVLEHYYEAVFNNVTNDFYGFSIIYYFLNVVEFLEVGFLLLVGSVVCVNLHQISKNTRTQSYFNTFLVFNFFFDFLGFSFLRRQNIIKQGNAKAAVKLFKKK